MLWFRHLSSKRDTNVYVTVHNDTTDATRLHGQEGPSRIKEAVSSLSSTHTRARAFSAYSSCCALRYLTSSRPLQETVYICIRTIGAPHRMPLSPLPFVLAVTGSPSPIALASPSHRPRRSSPSRRNDGITELTEGRRCRPSWIPFSRIQVVLVRGINGTPGGAPGPRPSSI